MPLAVQREEIAVHGAAAELELVRSGRAGLLLRVDEAAHACWFGSWLALLPAATNLNLMGLERVTSVAQALDLAPQIGIPDQNVVIGDREGHIGWTIFARIPQDSGAQRAAGTSGWTGTRRSPAHLRSAARAAVERQCARGLRSAPARADRRSPRQPRRRIRSRRTRRPDPR